MCGISGWFDLMGRRPPDRRLAQAMSDAIAHRGPDGEGFHFEPGIALGHRRLAIIDLETGQQPMFTQGDRIAIVLNGEIYNYRELRAELEARGHFFRTKSDTEVILRAWVEWNERCVERLNGMFAFALWDRDRQTLFLARDRLGERPLYYAMLPDQSFIFGSELKALLECRTFPRTIDPCAIEDFFAFGYITDPKTIYRDARKLDAATTLTLERGKPARFRTYWEPAPAATNFRDLDEGAEALRGLLDDSVKSQLVADVPVGTFLSGGVDSSAIASLMARAVHGDADCFTIGFEDKRFDERAYASSVASRYGLRHRIEIVSSDDIALVEALPRIFDEPFGDSSALPAFQLARLASRSVKVALSGDGGDELFAGYRRYVFHAREEAIRSAIPDVLRRPMFGALGRAYPQLDWAPRPLRARQTFRELSCDTAEGYFHNVSVVDDPTRNRLFSRALKRQIGDYRAVDTIEGLVAKAPSDDTLAVAQYVDLKSWLVGDILTKVDRTAMACGLEVRVPMLDPKIAEWALGLPRAFKLDRGEGKRVLKRALEPMIAREILYRPKQGFSVPLAAWFRGSFGERFAQALTASRDVLGEYFELPAVSELLDGHRGGWADHSRALWLLWMFEGFLSGTHRGREPEVL